MVSPGHGRHFNPFTFNRGEGAGLCLCGPCFFCHEIASLCSASPPPPMQSEHRTQTCVGSGTRGPPSSPAQLALQHVHVPLSLLLHVGFCKTNAQGGCKDGTKPRTTPSKPNAKGTRSRCRSHPRLAKRMHPWAQLPGAVSGALVRVGRSRHGPPLACLQEAAHLSAGGGSPRSGRNSLCPVPLPLPTW